VERPQVKDYNPVILAVRPRASQFVAAACRKNPAGRTQVKITSMLYRLARLSRDAEVISSGDPKKMTRRAKNKFLGRTIVRRLFRL
jgi:hypothetical protein